MIKGEGSWLEGIEHLTGKQQSIISNARQDRKTRYKNYKSEVEKPSEMS